MGYGEMDRGKRWVFYKAGFYFLFSFYREGVLIVRWGVLIVVWLATDWTLCFSFYFCVFGSEYLPYVQCRVGLIMSQQDFPVTIQRRLSWDGGDGEEQH